MGTKVKDKIYYMAEHLNVPKSWVPMLLDVSDTTLVKWSYNPRNVSEEMSERIFLRVAILDGLGFSFWKGEVHLQYPYTGGQEYKTYWAVRVKDDVYYLPHTHYRMPNDPPKALVALVRNAVAREENQHPLYVYHTYTKISNGPLSKIAADSSLEMPLGVMRWENIKGQSKEDVE